MPRQFFKLCFTLPNQLTHTQLFLLKTMKTQKNITPEKTGSRDREGKGEREREPPSIKTPKQPLPPNNHHRDTASSIQC